MRLWMAVPMLALAACAMAQTASDKPLAEKFASYYEPVPAIEVTPSVPATPLPLELTKAANWEQAQGRLSEPARALLAKNGFAVSDAFANDKVDAFYKSVKDSGLPLFITSDSLLHLYHIQFDETLKGIEERQFIDQLAEFSAAMRAESARTVNMLLAASIRQTGQERSEASWSLCRDYFAVAEELLRGPRLTDPPISQKVQAELALIAAHAGFAQSPLFGYKEDYSQYVPRGHYTRSEPLKRYFKAMMWYGRMAFLIKGNNETIKDALVSEEVAKIQTLAALHIAEMLRIVTCKVGANGAEMKAQEIWERIYSVTAFYVGFADDLTPEEYGDAFGRLPMDETMHAPEIVQVRWAEIQAALARLRPPEIYSGTGNQEAGPAATEADLIKALANTQGMRLMGQRFIPDSYIMGRLVFPAVGQLMPRTQREVLPLPFTAVQTPAGIIRGFPRGLDVAAAFPSPLSMDSSARASADSPSTADRAAAILQAAGDASYERYMEEISKLKGKFVFLSEKAWNRNLYWSWLYGLKGLEGHPPKGYPTFMSTSAWADKQLNAFLGSWSQLRHDTILYAKQSNTMMATGMPMRPKMVEGYVEPVPELYRRLLGLARMSRKGLDEMKALDDAGRARLTALEGIIERLHKISASELTNRKLSEDDYEFIRSFGDRLKYAVAGVSAEGLETTIIADVHTDANSRQVLEEGTGPMRGMAVAYPMPDGTLVIGFGPVFSYYEFKQPMADRLTDEAWKALLRKSPPPLPEWTKSFSVPVE